MANEAIISALHALADWYEQHPDSPADGKHLFTFFHGDSGVITLHLEARRMRVEWLIDPGSDLTRPRLYSEANHDLRG